MKNIAVEKRVITESLINLIKLTAYYYFVIPSVVVLRCKIFKLYYDVQKTKAFLTTQKVRYNSTFNLIFEVVTFSSALYTSNNNKVTV